MQLPYHNLLTTQQSEPTLGNDYNDGTNYTEHTVSQAVFDTIEAVSVLVFTLDFTARLITASKQKAYRSAYAYMTSFFGIVDFVSIAPWYIQVLCATMCP
jgi:hypothetical protein